MAKKRSERLRSLLKLAHLREDNAARKLADSAEKLSQVKQQSRQLSLYNTEYQQQYRQRTQQQVSVRELHNYLGFFQQLDTVQLQQQMLVEQCDGELEEARRQWLQVYHRRRVLDDIRARSLVEEEAVRERKLQSELDDRAARRDPSRHRN